MWHHECEWDAIAFLHSVRPSAKTPPIVAFISAHPRPARISTVAEWLVCSRSRCESERTVKISALVGVKDEVELIEPAIDHLRRIGVDLIKVFDMGSSDGTLEFLRAQKTQADFKLFEMDDQAVDAGPRLLQLTLEAAREDNTDWAIFLDADEFWIPATGRLKDCAALADSDLLSVNRYNVALGPNGPMMPSSLSPPGYDELLMFVQWIPDLLQHLRDSPDAVWSRGVPMPKLMVRPNAVKSISYGMHFAVPTRAETEVRRGQPQDLLIAHLPFSTPSRFERKLDNIRKLISRHDAEIQGTTAWHWRRWLTMSATEVVAEFDRQRVDPASLQELRSGGAISSAGELLRRA